MTKDEFTKQYTDALRECMAANPDAYLRGLDPDKAAANMVRAIEADSFSHTDAPALKLVMKRLGVRPYTRQNIRTWFKENVK